VINDDPVPMRPVGGVRSRGVGQAERDFCRVAVQRTDRCSTGELVTRPAGEIGADTLTRFTQKVF
jgi:hypothetical protein